MYIAKMNVPYAIELRAAMQEFSVDASDLLENPRSVLTGIPMERNIQKDSLFAESAYAEMDALTIMAVELIKFDQI